MNIRLKLLVLFVVTLAVLSAVGGYVSAFYKDVNDAEEVILMESTRAVEQSYQVESLFSKQMSDWKNVLLRGNEVGKYYQYLSSFYRSEKACREAIDTLLLMVQEDLVLSVLVEDLKTAHNQAGRTLRKAVQIYNDSDYHAGSVTDQFVSDIEVRPNELLQRIIAMLAERRVNDLNAWNEYRQDQETLLFVLFAGLIVIAICAMVWVVDKNIGKPAEQAAYLADVIENVQSIARFGTWDWDSRDNEHYWSKGVYEILGLAPESQPNTELFISRLEPEDRERVNNALDHANRFCSPFEFEAKVLRADGSSRVILQRGEVRRIRAGQLRMTSLIYDISELKAAEQRLSYLANYDALTNLPNRSLFLDRLEHATSLARRNQTKVALIFLDLDQFKAVNDAMGHPAGDALLVQVAEQLKNTLRDIDTAARLGGDEFTVVLERIRHAEDVELVAESLMKAINRTYRIAGQDVFVSTSMGITIFPDDGQETETLLRNADTAMYLAKEKGRSGFQFFTEELNVSAQKRLVMHNNLRKALERNEFQLFFQPIVELATGRVVSAEVLLRWYSAGEIVSPVDFIPPLEETGLIVSVGDWVLKQACLQAKAWQRSGIDGLRVAVNLSVRQLRQSDIADRVRMALNEAELSAELLELEITESTLIDSDIIGENLKKIESMGVRLAIDDFGTGYSSLSYLHSMPNKLFEATFAGIPVCVPDRPDQKEFVDLVGHGIAADQTDPLAIAAALRELVENPESFRLTDRAKQLLDREYSWQAQVKTLLALYERPGAKVAA